MKNIRRIRSAAFAVLMVAAGPPAFAAGTTAGTAVSNTATVDYEVLGVNQTDVNSNTTNFVVDRKINLTVAEVGGAPTSVAPGSTDEVLTFTVTNLSNSVQDFALAAANSAGDDFDATGVTVFVESGANAGYQAGEDLATFIDELAADGSKTVYIVGDIPITRVNGDDADLTLTATAAQSTVALTGVYTATVGTLAANSAETNTGVVDDATFIDTVFGDIAGVTDVAEDGKHSDNDQYTVTTASIAVTKSQTVISDPFNGTTNPKAIPGAILEYCITVSNTALLIAATSVVITDVLGAQPAANLTYVAGSIKVDADCAASTGTAVNDLADADRGEFTAATQTITARVASVAGGASNSTLFRVTID